MATNSTADARLIAIEVGGLLKATLTGTISLPALILAKAAKLTVKGKPFYWATNLLHEQLESP